MVGMRKIGLGVAGVIAAAVVLGGALLWRPDIPYETLEQRYAVATSRYADLPGGFRAHYRDDGPRDAPVVVLVHGFGDSFLSWEGWIKVLARDYRVITVDLPGHGLTRAPKGYAPSAADQVKFVTDLVKAAGVDRYAIAGSSMGGGVAWRTALADKDNVWSLILVDAAGWPNASSAPPTFAFKLLTSPVGRFYLETAETRPITSESLKANFVNTVIVTPAFVERWVAVQRAPGHRPILMQALGGDASPATAETLAGISAPTLVLWGEQDKMLEVRSAHRFAEAIPGAKLITYPDVGHLPQLEIPEKSVEDARVFLQSTRPDVPTAG